MPSTIMLSMLHSGKVNTSFFCPVHTSRRQNKVVFSVNHPEELIIHNIQCDRDVYQT